MDIAAARKKAGLTQRGLAEKLGVSRGAVAQWEMAQGTRPDPEHAVNMVRILPGLTLDAIYSARKAA